MCIIVNSINSMVDVSQMEKSNGLLVLLYHQVNESKNNVTSYRPKIP